MAALIKLFQSLQKYNQILGIHPTKPNQSYSFNLRSVFVLLSLISLFTSSAAYLVFKAEAIAEYAQCFYLCITPLAIFINFVAICLKMRNILQLIEKCEEFIQKSSFT